MATFNAVNAFADHLAKGVHNFATAGTTLNLALTNTAPVASTVVTLANITQIASGNGYVSGGKDTNNTYSWTAATDTAKITSSATSVVWTATVGAMASFRYVVLYNDTVTAPSNAVLGWWDYGSQVALSTPGDQFIVDWGASIFTINV